MNRLPLSFSIAALFTWALIVSTTRVSAQDFPISTSDTNVGYIDSATIATRIRIRADAGYDMFPPDRAEFFYAAGSPGTPANSIDYQELSTYCELALNDCFSGFVEMPIRLINPDVSKSSFGVADINVGLKALLLADETSCTTFQLRTYLPTGDDRRRLGTGNVNIEPGILQLKRLSESWLMENEVKAWVPLTNDDSAGTVLRYGVGLSYTDPARCACRPTLSPVVEMVGWSVLDGMASTDTNTRQSAAGDTIINAKFGLRLSYKGEQLYAGFGQALTSQTWYEQLFRLEYRVQF